MPDLLHIVAQPTRQQILRAVWTQERSAGDIASRMNVTFGAVSQNLRVLHRAKLVTLRRDGRHRFYKADQKALGPLAAYLKAHWHSRLTQLKQLAEAEERSHGPKRRR